MNWLFQRELFIVFTLVLARVSGLMVIGPIFGTPEVPARVRALFAVALAFMITPVQLSSSIGGRLGAASSLVDFLLLMGGELLIGLTLGLGVLVLFSGVELAGQVIGQVSGMAVADVFNPGIDANVSFFSQFLHIFTLAVYVAIGGHRMLLAGLLDTYTVLPPGGGTTTATVVDATLALLSQSFSLGVRVAAPATVALLLSTLVMGLVSRTLPQLNILAVGFGVNAFVAFAVLSTSLGTVAWVFQDEFEVALEVLFEALGSAASSAAL